MISPDPAVTSSLQVGDEEDSPSGGVTKMEVSWQGLCAKQAVINGSRCPAPYSHQIYSHWMVKPRKKTQSDFAQYPSVYYHSTIFDFLHNSYHNNKLGYPASFTCLLFLSSLKCKPHEWRVFVLSLRSVWIMEDTAVKISVNTQINQPNQSADHLPEMTCLDYHSSIILPL